MQLGRQYPYAAPGIKLHEDRGLSREELSELRSILYGRANKFAELGTVVMLDLVRDCEDYLVTHNRDPLMSAWEQMKAREALKLAEKNRRMNEEEAHLKRYIAETREDSSRQDIQTSTDKKEFDEEMTRQMEALAKANVEKRKHRMQLGIHGSGFGNGHAADHGNTNENDNSGDGDEDNDDDVDDDNDDGGEGVGALGLVGSSRYATDFIELGLLGRGGGGEVVKVRNKLDRRLCECEHALVEAFVVSGLSFNVSSLLEPLYWSTTHQCCVCLYLGRVCRIRWLALSHIGTCDRCHQENYLGIRNRTIC